MSTPPDPTPSPAQPAAEPTVTHQPGPPSSSLDADGREAVAAVESFLGRSASNPAEAATLPHVGPSAAATALPVQVPGYEILGELGRGGMGVVYKARQIKLDRVVALKMILAGGHAGETDLIRFKTEAEAVARLQQPNIVQIFEVGEHGGLPFFSLEFCSGGGLDRRLNGTPLPPQEAAALVETLARAMHAAHEKGVIHRDLKPANVLLAEDGTPKISDFGLAKKLDAAGQTQSGAIMGTPSYMAPEQAAGKGKELGPACDVYALGAILYECLTGRPPFKAATPLDTILQVVADEPAPPRRLQSKIPADMETVCLKCLEKPPGRRYATALELAEDLRRFQVGEPIRARAVGAWERAVKWARRRPALAAAYGLLAAALVLGLAGGGATWLWRRAEGARREAEGARGDAVAAALRAQTAEGEVKEAKRRLARYAYDDCIFLAQREWDAGNVEQARDLLQEAGDIQEQLTPGQRPWEWDYLNRVLHPELAVLNGHTGAALSVAFSPDGRRVATAGGGGAARLWDASSGALLTVLQGHTDLVDLICFSPDGSRIATASRDKTARLWDAESGEQTAVWRTQSDRIIAVSFGTRDGQVAAEGPDRTVRLWDLASGKQLAVLKGHTGYINSIDFNREGGRVATASEDKTARLWDAESGKQLATFQGHTADVISVAFSPNGGRVATASHDKTARLWECASGKQVAVLEGHKGLLGCAVFSPDGQRIATVSDDKTARLGLPHEWWTPS